MKYFKGYVVHLGATVKHKAWVLFYLSHFCTKLMYRGIVHDLSKFSHIEANGFAQTIFKLKTSKYGSEEYYKLLLQLAPSLENHYKKNKHHPEHWPNGVSGMDLTDFVELTFDWLAAVKRYKDGDPIRSAELNKIRFEYSDTVESILVNTFRRMGYKRQITKVEIE